MLEYGEAQMGQLRLWEKAKAYNTRITEGESRK